MLSHRVQPVSEKTDPQYGNSPPGPRQLRGHGHGAPAWKRILIDRPRFRIQARVRRASHPPSNNDRYPRAGEFGNAPPWGGHHGNPLLPSLSASISGFERSRPTRESTWGQPDQGVDFEDVAAKLVGAVQEFKAAEPERPLILVAYSCRAEFSAISNLVPQFCRLISSWVDLQPLVMDAYHKHTDYPRLDGLRISLRYAMRTLGLCTGYQPSGLHHAGNDALRTLAIMACLTHENAQFGRINEHRREQMRLRGTERSRGLRGKRPRPPSRYPHVAKVTVVPAADQEDEEKESWPLKGAVDEEEQEQELSLPPVDARAPRPRQVWDFFLPYKPDAI